MDNQTQIAELVKRLNSIILQQKEFNKEISALKTQIQALRSQALATPSSQNQPPTSPSVKEQKKETSTLQSSNPVVQSQSVSPPTIKTETPANYDTKAASRFKKKPGNWEKFIGENLISKIGILIILIGVVIGTKYAIEHDMISPLTRIVLGYLSGTALLTLALKFREKYEKYSAVLLSGALAIFYFITFAAYDFYGLMSQTISFVVMFLFTCFAVFSAFVYNQRVIAHIGLLGAFGVPFLLSDGSGNVPFLFSYLALVNIGILVIALKKQWKFLFVNAFVLTWAIYIGWYITKANSAEDTGLILGFSTLFYFIYYAVFAVNKLIDKLPFDPSDVVFILLNSTIYYLLGIHFFMANGDFEMYKGLFTVFNGFIHLLFAGMVFKFKLADQKLLHFLLVLVLAFISLAIPVQLDGNIVTLLWVCEGIILFAVSFNKGYTLFVKMAYVLLGIALLSLLEDAAQFYELMDRTDYTAFKLFRNSLFYTLFIFSMGLASVYRLVRSSSQTELKNQFELLNIWILPSLAAILGYLTLASQIMAQFQQWYWSSELMLNENTYSYNIYNKDYRYLGYYWITVYTLCFALIGLSIGRLKKLNPSYLQAGQLVGLLSMAFFLIVGLYNASELRESVLGLNSHTEYFSTPTSYLWLRYLGIALAFGVAWSIKKVNATLSQKIFSYEFVTVTLHFTAVWILSSELINILELSKAESSYKLGLSILWGIYALFMIFVGIKKRMKFLRISGIVLFGFTLVKLFFYDLASLNTISKTIVFVTLGALLLVISFLYNKYKSEISDD